MSTDIDLYPMKRLLKIRKHVQHLRHNGRSGESLMHNYLQFYQRAKSSLEKYNFLVHYLTACDVSVEELAEMDLAQAMTYLHLFGK